jgi:hypothetical protein
MVAGACEPERGVGHADRDPARRGRWERNAPALRAGRLGLGGGAGQGEEPERAYSGYEGNCLIVG